MGTSSEHWRTIYACSICCQTPESTPIFRCKTGHNYCKNCYEELRRNSEDSVSCQICGSKEFQADVKSPDFLRKLKMKPGIGRSFRYKIKRADSPHSRASSCERWKQAQSELCPADDTLKESVTVEKLFRLPREDLEELFAQETRLKIRNLTNPLSCANSKFDNTSLNGKIQNDIISLSNTSFWLSKNTKNNTIYVSQSFQQESKKPVKCPHDPCKKYVAISSFLNHFKHEHGDIPRYSIDRGKQLVIPCDASVIEHNLTLCVGIITVYDVAKLEAGSKAPHGLVNTCNKLKTRVPLDTFWLLVSGSPQEHPYSSYVLYWLFVCNANPYHCTLEMASADDRTSASIFCGINGSGDSQEIEDVAKSLNCLYLTRGSMMAILEDGPEIRLGVTIH